MPSPLPKLPEIPEEELTPLVQQLLEIIRHQREQIEDLQDEVRRLKGHKGKPPIKPSQMDKETPGGEDDKKRKRGPQRAKTAQLQTVDEVIAPEGWPADAREQGWRFKGYADYVVQDLVITAHAIRYRLEEWQGPNGEWMKGRIPLSVKGHYGSELISYVLYQHHHQHVTQPLLLEQLHALGIEISAGQLNHLLTEDQEVFHQEKAQILEAGLQVSSYLQTDDTGARHNGKNGYCTFIGNEFFSWFESTESKSRVNFLSLLQAGHADYVLNAGALAYMAQHKLPQAKIKCLGEDEQCFANRAAFEAYLTRVGICGPRHRAIATEGALVGSLLARGFPVAMGIVSDDAGQFNVFRHALCWIHAERNINKLVPLNAIHAKQIVWVREQVWDLYADLKAYKTDPLLQTASVQEEIRERFQELCRTRTAYQTFNGQLKRLLANQEELLRVLEDPRLPLHNNLSENDIREYVKRRKISGSTRSDEGRRCRDTFASLKKTCRKLGLSFWQYLRDRVSGSNNIPSLGEAVRAAAAGA
jgi:hypothetical protein